MLEETLRQTQGTSQDVLLSSKRIKKSGFQVKNNPSSHADTRESCSLYFSWWPPVLCQSLSQVRAVNAPVFLSFCSPSRKAAIQGIPWVIWMHILWQGTPFFQGRRSPGRTVFQTPFSCTPEPKDLTKNYSQRSPASKPQLPPNDFPNSTSSKVFNAAYLKHFSPRAQGTWLNTGSSRQFFFCLKTL